MQIRSLRHPVSALVALILALGLAGGVAAAQGTTGSAAPPSFSSAILDGTCDAPGEVVYQLGDFTRVQEADVVGSRDIDFTLVTQSTIESNLDTLFGSTTTYVFAVMDKSDPAAPMVACGELGGVNVNGQIAVALVAGAGRVADEGDLVGAAIFGATNPTQPTTAPAAPSGQVPVQAYLSEAALQPAATPTPVPTQPPVTPTPVPATPTAAPSTPTATETATATATGTATETATATQTATATATETATATGTAEEEETGN